MRCKKLRFLRRKIKECLPRHGFTLVEVITVLAILSILAVVAVPSMLGFMRQGERINRTAIARTLYLAAQNQLTNQRVSKTLKSGIARDYYNKTGDRYEEKDEAVLLSTSVYNRLSGYLPAKELDNGNEPYVQYISKPNGVPAANDPVAVLLDPVILDKSILNGAILIEYNIRTGVVLSVFYSEMLTEFTYSSADSDSSIYGSGGTPVRGMGADGYEPIALSRNQGYYGVGDTGTLDEPIEASINIYDSYSRPLPDDSNMKNVLYAEIIVPRNESGAVDGVYDLLVGGVKVEQNVSFNSLRNSLSEALTFSSGSLLAYEYSTGIEAGYARVIWVLDFVGGNMTNSGADSNAAHSFGVKYASKIIDGGAVTLLDGSANLRVGIQGSASAESFTEAHPYFYTETQGAYSGNNFTVRSPRHLYNIRYVNTGSFTQRADITLTGGSYPVRNFQPVPDFKGSYNGTGFVIRDLTVNLPGNDNTGLFGLIKGEKPLLSSKYVRASVLGLTLIDPDINGGNNTGAVCGTLEGFITGVYIRYENENHIRGVSNVGGIAGLNRGVLTDSTFVSPTDIEHISSADKSTAGGVAGRNENGAQIKRVLFLALAPKNGEHINPVVGTNETASRDIEKVCYLSGKGLQPEYPDYNTETVNSGGGEGFGTTEMNAFTGADLSAGWILPGSAELYNQYPYPYSQYSERTAERPHWPVVDDLRPYKMDIYDSYTVAMPGGEGCENALYAEIKVPKSQFSRNHDLSLGGTIVVRDLKFDGFTNTAETLSVSLSRYDPDSPVNKHLIYRNDDTLDDENARFIWVIDYIGGDMVSGGEHSVFNKYGGEFTGGIPVATNFYAAINSVSSATRAHPYFYTEGSYSGNHFNVYSARHLYNVRYYPAGIFTQRSNIDFFKNALHPITRISPAPELSGSYTGYSIPNYYSISNLVVAGESSVNTGLFGSVSGRVTGITLESPLVYGGSNTGSVCGVLTNSGIVNGAYIRYTTGNTNTISGSGSVGGIAGMVRGTINDSTFISPETVVHISASAGGIAAGGIVGSCDTTARLQNLLFLALAPETGGKICPITGNPGYASPANLNGLYYLSGTAIRPVLPSDSYNLQEDNGIGKRLGTNEIYRIGIAGWREPLQTAESEILKVENTLYPYPYYYAVQSTQAQLAAFPHWPIAEGGGDIKLSNIAYYEIYTDNTYGTWFAKDGSGSGTLKNDKTIKEAGYAVIVSEKLSGRHFFARNDLSASWTVVASPMDFRNDTDFARGIADAAREHGSWVYKLPLQNLVNLAAQSKPLQIMHTSNSGGGDPEEIYGFLHPLFAKGLYAYQDKTPDVADFYIRTPWQMQNINVIVSQTAGKNFRQEVDLDYTNTGMGVNAEVQGVSYKQLGNSAIRGTFAGTYYGNGKSVSSVVFNANGNSTVGLFSVNNGIIRDVYLKNSAITGQGVIGGIAGQNASGGRITGCKVIETTITGTGTLGGTTGRNDGLITETTVQNTTVRSSNDNVGGIAGINTNKIERSISAGVTAECSSNTGGAAGSNSGTIISTTIDSTVIISNNDNAGGIAGDSSGSVSDSLAVNATISGGVNNAGGLTGRNSGSVVKSGVHYTTVTKTGASLTVGGIAGLNSGLIEDVYFLSMADLGAEPVPSHGGGIAGRNTGTVRYAFYYAPAPNRVTGSGGNSVTTIYPIVRDGNDAEKNSLSMETCFYLAGNRYSFNNGVNWMNENYNRIRRENSGARVVNSGGGAGLVTKFVDKEWIDFYYGVSLPGWIQLSAGYPYPMINGLTVPQQWPIADSPIRPSQVDREDWGAALSTSGRAINLDFVNGSFNVAFPDSAKRGSAGTNGVRREYVHMSGVDGWNTRPVNSALASNDNAQWIEFQEPVSIPNHDMFNEYMYTDHDGGAYSSTASIQNSPYKYVELNADVQGTLYQVSPTTPGQQFLYSFYHASRLAGTTTNEVSDKMHFYLSGIDRTATVAKDSELVLIRPCISPRLRGTYTSNGNNRKATFTDYNPAAKKTVLYGAYPAVSGNFNLGYYSDKFTDYPASGNVYLYDLWVEELGYGITFWSKTNVTQFGNQTNRLPSDVTSGNKAYGVDNIRNAKTSSGQRLLPSSLLTDAQTHVIGYWDVSYGWKNYYGMYTVPAGQVNTEFAYQSQTANPTNGNYLDGISFKAPAFLSIDKFAKMENAQGGLDEVKFVKPGDTVIMELVVRSWGEIPAGDIVIEDKLSPFDEYFDYVQGSVTVKKGSTSLSANVTAPNASNNHTLVISLSSGATLSAGETITITFKLKTLYTVKSTGGDGDISTLLYYFRNQAVVTYKNSEFSAYVNAPVKEKNASGPDPVIVFIDPVSLNNTVKTSGIIGNDLLIDGPFDVTMTIKDTLEAGNAITTTGILSIVLPKGFEIVGDITDGNGAKAAATYSPNPDSSTRVTIRDANLNEGNKQEGLTYNYTLQYKGSGYGVSSVCVSADYKYLYAEESEHLNVMLEFMRPVVGIKIVARNDVFSVSDSAVTLLDITKNDNFQEKFSDGNYDVTPVVVLTDASGTAVKTFVDGNYNITNSDFSATLIRGSNMLEFKPVAGKFGSFDLYYRIELDATRIGGTPEHFDLSSHDVTKVTVNVMPSVSIRSEVRSVNAIGIDPLIGGPFEVTVTIDNSYAKLDTADGVLYIAVPQGFTVTDTGTLPSGAKITGADDGPYLITIPNVNLSKTTAETAFTYTMDYNGEGYGVVYTNVISDTKYTFTEKGIPLTVTLETAPVVGILINAEPDAFTVEDYETALDILRNDNLTEKLIADGYSVSPVVVLTDNLGNAHLTNANGNYYIRNNEYTAEFDRETDTLMFEPEDGCYGEYELYYRIELVAGKPGGIPESFTLSSVVTPVNIYVNPIELTGAVRTLSADENPNVVSNEPFEITLTVSDKDISAQSGASGGMLSFVIPEGFALDLATLLEGAVYSVTGDSSLSVYIPNVDLGAERKAAFIFEAEYRGGESGTFPIVTDVEYSYTDKNGISRSASLGPLEAVITGTNNSAAVIAATSLLIPGICLFGKRKKIFRARRRKGSALR